MKTVSIIACLILSIVLGSCASSCKICPHPEENRKAFEKKEREARKRR